LNGAPGPNFGSLGANLDRFARGRIEPFARGALHLLEGAKAHDADLVALFDCRHDSLDDCFQHALGLRLAQVMCSSHFSRQLDSIHAISPSYGRNLPSVICYAQNLPASCRKRFGQWRSLN
jgi:hypothetical protein